MARAAPFHDHDDTPEGDHIVVLHDVTWEDYERVLEIRGEHSAPRLSYLEGELEIMSPGQDHEFIKSLTQGNANMKARGGYTPMNNIGGRNWQLITFDNVNEATGRPELINIATTPLKDGDLIYMIAVCPTDDYAKYQSVFLTILRSIQLTD